MADEMENPGGDAWLEILKRVPAETLGQCMCVCKAWYSLILSPHFIAAHALTQSQTPQILLRDFTKLHGIEVYRLFSDHPADSAETLGSFLCPFKPRLGLYFRVVGAVNGVICLSDDIFGHTDSSSIILWNPTVHKYVMLPKPNPKRPTFDSKCIFVLGFGYHDSDCDFKVVRLSYPQDREGLDVTPPMVELYSMKEHAWRSVPAPYLDYCIPEKGWSQCFFKGSAHWVAYDRRENDRGFNSTWLLLFDFGQEKFKRMKLPSPLTRVCPLSLTLSEFQGLLSVTHHHRSAGFVWDLTSVDLWVKKLYTDGKSWTKMFSIDATTGIRRLLHPTANGQMLATTAEDTGIERLMYPRGNGEPLNTKTHGLVFYNTNTKEMVELGGHGNAASYYACSFTPSLVFLGHGSPAVSYEEYYKKRRRFVPGAANVELEDETGNSSSSDDEDNLPKDPTLMKMGPPTGLLYPMMKFNHKF